MNGHKYILEPYRGTDSRYICPACGKKEFTLYIDTQTGKHISPKAGRCNRESNCGYHYSPSQYFEDNNLSPDKINESINLIPTPPKRAVSYIDVDTFKASLGETNSFIRFLYDLFPTDVVRGLVSRYFIGTSDYWPGSAIFWQIDIRGRIRTGKIMLYDAGTGKRVKEPFNHITWVHAALKLPDFNLKQCFFGEHLLKETGKPAAIVESEKTAVISSVYFPQLIWIAAGSLNNINADKCHVLRGRRVILFPDCQGFEKWNARAKELGFTCSDLLERKASLQEREQGFDLADYLVKYDFREFNEPQNINVKKPSVNLPEPPEIAISPRKENWLPELQDLEQFFKSVTLPPEVQLNQCSRIFDIPKFIDAETAICKAQNGKSRYRPYFERLQELKRIILLNLN